MQDLTETNLLSATKIDYSAHNGEILITIPHVLITKSCRLLWRGNIGLCFQISEEWNLSIFAIGKELRFLLKCWTALV